MDLVDSDRDRKLGFVANPAIVSSSRRPGFHRLHRVDRCVIPLGVLPETAAPRGNDPLQRSESRTNGSH
jgi:hypothetical protein